MKQQFKNQWKVVSLSVQTRLFSSTNGIYNRKAFTMTPCKTCCGSPHLFRESALVFWLLKGGSGSDPNCYSTVESYRFYLLMSMLHAWMQWLIAPCYGAFCSFFCVVYECDCVNGKQTLLYDVRTLGNKVHQSDRDYMWVWAVAQYTGRNN